MMVQALLFEGINTEPPKRSQPNKHRPRYDKTKVYRWLYPDLIPPGTPPCRNPECKNEPTIWRRRGLCWRCHRSRRIRKLYEPFSAYCRDTYLWSIMPAKAIEAGPGSPRKRWEMAERAARRECLHHDDEPVSQKKQCYGMLRLLADVLPNRRWQEKDAS